MEIDLINIALVLFFASMVMVLIPGWIIRDTVIKKDGEDNYRIPGAIVSVMVEYVTYTKEKDGKVGIWFKVLVLGFILGIISGIMIEYSL